MDKFIKPFAKAGSEILSQVANVEVVKGEHYTKKEVLLKDDVGVIIGITGVVKGQVILSFPENIAKMIVSKMMGGMPIVILDDLAKSAISELGNMILGNAIINLSDLGTSINITPPSIMLGKEMVFSTINLEVLCIPLDIEDEKIEMNIMIEKKK